MGEFRMPALGADMEEGTLVEWLVKPGDFVHRGELVAAVDTDKSVIEVETFEEGVVAELLAQVGDVLPVGAPLARITATPASGGPAEKQPVRRPVRRPARQPAPEPTRAAPAERAAGIPGTAVPVSPPVRQFAHRVGVDTAAIAGTGPGGAVTHADVERAAAAQARPQLEPESPHPAPEPTVKRQKQARGAEESGRTPALAAPAHVRSSPRARKLAREHGIDLAMLTGTGPEGAVTEADVNAAITATPVVTPTATPTATPAVTPEAPPAPPESAEHPTPAGAPTPAPDAATARAAGLRRAIGTLMARSKKTIPHYYLTTTIDLRAATAWMETANVGRPITSRLVPAVLLLKATALAARETPEMNGYFVDDEFRPSVPVHLGVAVALRKGGIVAPAILDADSLSLDDMMEGLRDLVARARGGRLQRAEMAEATLTVTNLGDLGVDSVYGVIYPPQVALVGFGRVAEQPWAHDGMVGVRPAVTATLSADHRVSDGMRGARFLSRIDELLQEPEGL